MCEEKRKRILLAQQDLARNGSSKEPAGGQGWGRPVSKHMIMDNKLIPDGGLLCPTLFIAVGFFGGVVKGMIGSWGGSSSSPRETLRLLEAELDSLMTLAK
jgi:hypothetical protein